MSTPVAASISSSTSKSNNISNSAKLLLACTGGAAVAITVVCSSFIAPAFRRICLPYVPATAEQIQNILHFLPHQSKAKLLDIGSGDGRIVIAAAKHGLQSEGVELNPWLVWYSRLKALIEGGIAWNAKFVHKDLWRHSLKSYEYIVIFGVEQMMAELENKIIHELPKGKIIACRFPLPNLTPTKSINDGINTVWFYDLDSSTNDPKKLPN